jgi:uncharacterized repeat protein (TIGR01451 family)
MKKSYPILTLLLLAFFGQIKAEGTKEMSPNAANITAIDSGSGGTMAFPGCAKDRRLMFSIRDHSTENMYFGFNWLTFSGGATDKIYYRIRKALDNTVIQGPALVYTTTVGSNGYIDTHAKALNGPNIGGVTTGYNPLTFDPNENGDYYFEFYRSTDLGVNATTDRISIPYFDFTVANTAGTKYPGRLFCSYWALSAFKSLASPFALGATANGDAEPVFYSYTTDKAIIKIDFNPGFRPFGFAIAITPYGVNKAQTNWLIGRKSTSTAPTTTSLIDGYPTFVNVPDPLIYPAAPDPVPPTLLTPAVRGCNPNYEIHYNLPAPGDVRVLLDLDGTPGIQNGTADRLLEAIDKPAGNNLMTWDGLDGLGNVVSPTAPVSIGVNYLAGRFNVPLNDVELNMNGINFSLMAPSSAPNLRMYWDDTALTPVTTCAAGYTVPAGFDNTKAGQVSPAHAWDYNGNSTMPMTIPAPTLATRGSLSPTITCDDFGDGRLINTFGWGITKSSPTVTVKLGCTNLSTTKMVNNLNPISPNNVSFTIKAKNNGPVAATGTVLTDVLPAGYTYVSHTSSVGTYDQITGDWAIGNLALSTEETLIVVAKVLSSGSLTNTAVVKAEQSEQDATDNTASVTPILKCTKPNASTDPAQFPTQLGITSLGRAGLNDQNWPMLRESAHLALESRTKGFVVNRLTTTERDAIPAANLLTGMMIYNLTDDCLQVNIDGTATGWKCFKTETCAN